jgi:phage baseplate assembly protein W
MANATTGQRLRRGLALPAIRTVGGYFASKSAHDTAWGDLLLAIFTPIGSRPGKRNFGSALSKVLFEPDPKGQQPLVESIIIDTAKVWVPHVVVQSVIVQTVEKVLQLRITFHLTGDATAETRLVRVNNRPEVRLLSGE